MTMIHSSDGAVRKVGSDESGQSAVEYAFIVSVTAVAFWVGRPMWMALIEGLQVYFDSFYFVLRLPIP